MRYTVPMGKKHYLYELRSNWEALQICTVSGSPGLFWVVLSI